MDQQQQTKIIMLSAALRARGDFRGAIDEVGKVLSGFDATYLVIAYREMLLSAAEAGFADEARRYAEIALLLEPGLPSALDYLSRQPANI